VIDLACQVVHIDDVLEKQLEFHAEVSISLHQCHQVGILKIKGHEFCIGRGYYAVEEEFGHQQICCGCSAVAWVVNKVSTHCDACSVSIFLVIMKSTHNSCICLIALSVAWYVFFLNKEDGFCGCGEAAYISVTNDFVHMSLYLVCFMRWWYSRRLPVSLSKTAYARSHKNGSGYFLEAACFRVNALYPGISMHCSMNSYVRVLVSLCCHVFADGGASFLSCVI
jgi:hypothetical protein